MTLILGIDPGLRNTGWGVISSSGSSLKFIAAGTIKSNEKESMANRLRAIHDGLAKVITQYRPDIAAIEETFINKSGSSSLKLGQARGAAMLTAALNGLEVYEYAATLVKKTVVGTGRGEKGQVAVMVGHLLPRALANSPDAADALAIAICHASHAGITAKLASTY